MLKYLDLFLKYMLILAVGTLTVSVFLQVLVRFVFKIPLPWTEEVARIAFVYSIYLGAILGAKEKSHIAVDVVLLVVPQAVRRVMETVIFVAVAVFLTFMTWQGVNLVMATGTQLTPVMQLPFRYIFVIIPASGAFMLMYLILGAVEDLRTRRTSP